MASLLMMKMDLSTPTLVNLALSFTICVISIVNIASVNNVVKDSADHQNASQKNIVNISKMLLAVGLLLLLASVLKVAKVM